MEIRQFDFEKDVSQVLSLWGSAGPGIQLSLSDTPEELRKKLKRDPDLFLVAVERGGILGSVLGGFDGRRGIIYHLAVAPEARNRGIGRNLMVELENRLRSKGCLRYYLLVTKDNQEAISFYQGIGCQVLELNVMGKTIA